MVDVITNSSTTIYTYQNNIKEAKELVQEVINLMGEQLSPDDVFYYGNFCDFDEYIDYLSDYYDEDDENDENDDEDENYKDKKYIEYIYEKNDYSTYKKLANCFIKDKIMSILKGKIQKPEWMEETEDHGDWPPSTYLYLIPKNDKFKNLAEKIQKLLSSIESDGRYNG